MMRNRKQLQSRYLPVPHPNDIRYLNHSSVEFDLYLLKQLENSN
jgi:hypothetical protein